MGNSRVCHVNIDVDVFILIMRYVFCDDLFPAEKDDLMFRLAEKLQSIERRDRESADDIRMILQDAGFVSDF